MSLMRWLPEVREVLRLFWDKNVKKVSPGALGMTFHGYPPIFDDRTGRAIAERLTCARWKSVPRSGFPDDGWIVLERMP